MCLSLVGVVAFFAAFAVSCGSINFGEVQPQDLCKCTPLEPDTAYFRHDEKHVPIPTMTPEEITVDTILSWPQDEIVLPDAPRTGRELQVFHVAQSFLQNVHVNGEDCDVDLEISQTADRCSMLRSHFYRTYTLTAKTVTSTLRFLKQQIETLPE